MQPSMQFTYLTKYFPFGGMAYFMALLYIKSLVKHLHVCEYAVAHMHMHLCKYMFLYWYSIYTYLIFPPEVETLVFVHCT